jgi:hypothetical protein
MLPIVKSIHRFFATAMEPSAQHDAMSIGGNLSTANKKADSFDRHDGGPFRHNFS